jgi:probable rRNA maturation factor
MAKVTVNKVYKGRIERKTLAGAKRMCMRVLKKEGYGKGDVALTFVDDAHIRQLNEKYRKLDRATDVLSFATGEQPFLGDVVISMDTAARNAKKLRNTIGKEVQRLVVHGTLHLLGYDHIRSNDRGEMRKKEGPYL